MGGIIHHRIAATGKNGQRAHIGHQIMVAKRSPPFRQKNTPVAGRGDFLGDIFHVVRGEELALLDIHGPPAVAGRQEQIGLTTEKGRNLENINHLGRSRDLLGCMHIGQERHAQLAFDLRQNTQPFLHAQSAERGVGGTIGLVV